MIRLEFRMRSDSVFTRLSAAFPRARFTNWCNFQTDVLEVEHMGAEGWPVIEAELRRLARPRTRVFRAGGEDPARHIVLMRCPHPGGNSTSQVLDRHDGLLLHPVVNRAGWKHYHAVALDEKRVEPMFRELRRLGEVEVLSKRRLERPLFREMFLVSATELVAGLTQKQAEAVLAAAEDGYYAVPRRTDYGTVARRRRVARTTFEEHVRKGESKIINTIAPYLAAYFGRAPRGS